MPKHADKGIRENGIAGRAQPLRLMLFAVRLESDELGDLAEKPGQRVGKADGSDFSNLPVLTGSRETAAPVAPLVERDDQSAIKWRGEESAGRMAQMVIKTLDAIARAGRHVSQDPEIVEFAAKLARRFV